MEMETTLPPETLPASPESKPGARTDGLAAAVAIEQQADATGSETNPLGPAKRIGRPPVHGRYSKAAGSDGKNPAPLPGPETMAPVESPGLAPEPQASVIVPPDLFAEVVRESLTLIETFAGTKLESIARQAGLTHGDITPQLRQAALGDRRKELIGKLAPLALDEWGIDPELSPTAAIGVLLVPWAFGATSAYWTLAKLAAEKAARERNERRQPDKI